MSAGNTRMHCKLSLHPSACGAGADANRDSSFDADTIATKSDSSAGTNQSMKTTKDTVDDDELIMSLLISGIDDAFDTIATGESMRKSEMNCQRTTLSLIFEDVASTLGEMFLRRDVDLFAFHKTD